MNRVISTLTIIAVLAAAWFITYATFADEKPAKKGPACPYCSMDTSKSPTQVIATYHEKGKDAKTMHFQSLGCYMRIAMVDPPKGEFSDVKILDTSTFGGKKPAFVAADKAWYVPLKALRMSMPPYLASFGEKSVAKDYAKEHESSVLSYKEAHKLVMEEIAEDDDALCPDCGMPYAQCEHHNASQHNDSHHHAGKDGCGCC